LYQDRSNITISPAPGRCGHVPLEIPLGALALGRLFQRHDGRAARVQVLGKTLDRAAFSRGVPALEDDHDLLAGVLDPVLELDQFDLQHALGMLVIVARHPLVVRIVLPPGVDGSAVRPEQDRVVVVGVHHAQPGEDREVIRVRGPGGRQRASHLTSTTHRASRVTGRAMC
jgi:hypothetical protein